MRSDICAFVLGIGKTSINPGGGTLIVLSSKEHLGEVMSQITRVSMSNIP
jgi:hypothetical protein